MYLGYLFAFAFAFRFFDHITQTAAEGTDLTISLRSADGSLQQMSLVEMKSTEFDWNLQYRLHHLPPRRHKLGISRLMVCRAPTRGASLVSFSPTCIKSACVVV